MKNSLLTTLLFSSAIACSLTLTGCNEKTAKLEPNNWNCRDDDTSTLVTRLQQQEKEGKIKDSSMFMEKCKQEKLGFFNDSYQAVKYEHENRKKLLVQWKKEAGVNPNDY